MIQHQHLLDPAGPQARLTRDLWDVYLAVLAAVFVLVMIGLVLAIRRSRRRALAHADAPATVDHPDASRERRIGVFVGASVGATIIILFALLVSDFFTQRAMGGIARPDPLAITVTGHQWWWEVRYEDSLPSRTLIGANEIHIPTGRPVRLTLTSTDVIHSFWVPQLAGKKDLIPSMKSTLWLEADSAGTYPGQCAEFCGHQHAHMRFLVIAHTPRDWEAWRQRQLLPAANALDSTQPGRHVFLAASCPMCHAIAGTPARAAVGPNLSHAGSARMLGAGTMPNTGEHLAEWIVDPSHRKPGVLMPPNPLKPQELGALVAWLASLK